MFASRAFSGLQGSGRNSLDLPVAALAGLAVAFVAFAAPANLLADLIGATGLPSIVPAAEPPLGIKARLGLGAGGALLAFALAFLVLRWLDRLGARRREEEYEEASVLETPRLRRRDIHPDAPARPPLLAVHELGEPELELNEVEPETPAPWLEPAATVARNYVAEPEPEPQPAPQPWAGATPATPIQASEESTSQADAYALSQRIWSAEPEAEAGETESGWEEPPTREPLQPEAFADPWQPDSEPPEEAGWIDDYVAPAPIETELPPESEREAPAEAADEAGEAAEPGPTASEAPEDPTPGPMATEPRPVPGSITELMARLEQGLARRRFAPPPQAGPTPAQFVTPEPNGPPLPDNDRLQNAIESLQRFASRQD